MSPNSAFPPTSSLESINSRNHYQSCASPPEVEIFRFLLPLILTARSNLSPLAQSHPPENHAFLDERQILSPNADTMSTNLLPSTTLIPTSKSTRQNLTRNAHSNSATFTPHSRLHRSLSAYPQRSNPQTSCTLNANTRMSATKPQLNLDMNQFQRPSRSHENPHDTTTVETGGNTIN